MKIVFLVKYYDGFIDSLTRKINTDLSYAELHDFVINESSNIFAPFVKEMTKLGHDASIIVPNLEILQRKWCIENGVKFDNNWLINIPKIQIQKIKPDILFINSNFEYYGSFLESVNPFVKKTCAWISCPFDKTLNLTNIDHIFTLFKPHYDFFIDKGISTTFTHAAFDSNLLGHLPKEKEHELTFVGGIGGYHKNREFILKKLIQKTPIKIWGYGFVSKNPIKNVLKQIKSGFIYKNAFQGEAWGMDMLKILSKSKITINVHGDIAKGHSVNMRMFEATGVGTLLLTEYTDDISNFFEPNKEIICYTNAEDAVKKINYYLKHDSERKKIAKAGQKRTLENYTYQKLSKEYINIFKTLLRR